MTGNIQRMLFTQSIRCLQHFIFTLVSLCVLSTLSSAQALNGTIKGLVTLEISGSPVHNVAVTILQLKRSVQTEDDGSYTFSNVPPGRYTIVAHLHRVPDAITTVDVLAGATATADLKLQLEPLKLQITVTASGSEETTFDSIQSVETLGSLELAQKNPLTLGEALENETGVAKRSLGPGSTRPVIRGFDGDRVLVMVDGGRVGSLASQSSDHGEPINVLTAEKVEVVRGPATLLYGSNAAGGVVNVLTGHDSPHEGVHGYVTGVGGTNSSQAGGSGGVEFGTSSWLTWLNGGGQRTNDYKTPLGTVTNSFTRSYNGAGGVGWYPGKAFLSTSYSYDHPRYGIPLDPEEPEEVRVLNMRRHNIRATGGFRDLNSFFASFRATFNYNDYQHQEIPNGVIGTVFKNKTYLYDGMVDQKKTGRWSGSFGYWGMHRDYSATGEEVLTPPTLQNAVAAFALETFDLRKIILQFGGRVEHNGFAPEGLPNRSFNGASAAAGVRIPLWEGGAFVTNYSHSYRAPAIEELYNNGPHDGTLLFEIGDPNLKRELNDGIDLSLRHSTGRLRGEVNYYYYHIKDFVFLAPTGEFDEESGFEIANYSQATSRFQGAEAKLDVGVHRNIWLNFATDYVNARLTASDTPLPRIPPWRGRFGIDADYKGFHIKPEVIIARDQDQIFRTETRTAGYTTFGLTASYTVAQKHAVHIFSVNAYNLGDRLYRNHVSLLKEFAPEIGRGVRFSYTMRFF